MAEDWFRSPAWDEAAQADFEARLARARPHSRQQYLRIKGLGLWHSGQLDAAQVLLERAVVAPDGHFHQTVSAWEHLADIARERGDKASAERLYRRILAEQPNLSGTSGSVELSLAETLLDSGRRAPTAEPTALLTSWLSRDGLKFSIQLFRYHVAVTRIAERVGDRQTARQSARNALALADQGPQLPRHPTVGIVHTDDATLKRLRKLAK